MAESNKAVPEPSTDIPQAAPKPADKKARTRVGGAKPAAAKAAPAKEIPAKEAPAKPVAAKKPAAKKAAAEGDAPVKAAAKKPAAKKASDATAEPKAKAPAKKVARLDDMAPMPNPAKARRKKPKPAPAPASVTAEPEQPETKEQEELDAFVPNLDDETTRQYVEANEREQAEKAEQAAKDEEDKADEFEEVTELKEEVVITLPLRKCNRCLHLMPTMTKKLPKELGGHTYGHEFDCFDRLDCPARSIKLVFNPFTNERIDEVVRAFLEDSNLKPMNEMYAEAKKISVGVYEDVHEKVRQRL